MSSEDKENTKSEQNPAQIEDDSEEKSIRKKIFKEAVKYVQTSEESNQISNKAKLKFYGLYKQAILGKCGKKRPSILKLIERMKHDAWMKYGGTLTPEEAMNRYVQHLSRLNPNWNKSAKL